MQRRKIILGLASIELDIDSGGKNVQNGKGHEDFSTRVPANKQ